MDRESRGQDLRLCSSETQGIMPTGDTFSECQRVLEVVAGEEFQRSESRMWRNFEGDSGAEGEGPQWSCRKWTNSFYLKEVRRWKGEASGDNATLRSPGSFAGNWVLKLVTEPGACPGAEQTRGDWA